MISIIVCSRDSLANKIHTDHIQSTVGCDNEYIMIDNSDNTFGLCKAYNSGAKKANGEILVFVHEDVFIITPEWGKILEDKFTENNSIGLIGVAGTQYLLKDNPFWVAPGRPFIHGKVVHEEKNKLILTVFSEENRDIETVAVDGLFFAVKKSLFDTIHFDENTFDRFHFYDLDICMQVRETHKIVVTPDILVKHLSGGTFKEEWQTCKTRFIDKYKNSLPATCTDKIPDTANRIPFDSFPLKQMVSEKTFSYIKNLGQNPLMTIKQSHKSVLDKPITVVTGMHRSGTSAVSGLLSKCGFSLGPKENLLNENKPKFDNQKGHFENTNVVIINEMILKASGGSWCNLPLQDTINDKGATQHAYITQFSDTFSGEIIKDPRLSLTLGLWKKYSSRIKNVVICFRHPLGVAGSLNKRNSFPIDAGLKLWYEYNARLIDNIENIPVVVVDYDNLMEHLEDDLLDILRATGASITKEEMAKRTDGFFEKNLNHNQFNENEIDSLPDNIRDMYKILKSQSIAVRMGR